MNSVWAVLVSLLGVLVYLWFRFEWQYGVGAIAALIHDVSAAIGIYAVTGLEFNLTSIAALLDHRRLLAQRHRGDLRPRA